MLTTHSDQGGYMVLAVAILLGIGALSGSWEAVQKSEAPELPQRIVTLSQSTETCGTRSFGSGLQMVDCKPTATTERRGGALFMKPPERD